MQEEFSRIDYQVGKTYPFTVNTLHYDFCELVDETGFSVYLQNTHGLNLVKGQHVECIVRANRMKRPKIELKDAALYAKTQTNLNRHAVEEVVSQTISGWDTEPFVKLLMMSEVEDRSFENDCREWIRTLKAAGQDLEIIRHDCTRFMEESSFFGLCSIVERDYYQQRLTLLIELLDYYIKAGKLAESGEEREFLDGILDKLEKTGYVYHPKENFNVMSCLLLNDSSLIEGSINRLFDIIRKWPLEVWLKEPFRSTLIKVLNLYVEDNVWNVDKQEDNTMLVRSLIQAISILLLLAGGKDAPQTDERLNLARLCVLSTYNDVFRNTEVLNLAMRCLLNREHYRPKYKLEDTDGGKVCLALKTNSPMANLWAVDTTSSFLSGRRRLVISPQGVAVYSGDAKEKAVLPANIGLWQNLQVYADKRKVASLAGKIKISDCKKLWEDIENELFRQKAPVQETAKAVQNGYRPGDHIIVNVVRIDDADKGKVYCSLKGENEECGYINHGDIVGYMHEFKMWMFQEDGGRPFDLEAVVEEDLGNGYYRLSMREIIKDWTNKRLNPGDTIICSLGSYKKARSSTYVVPAISNYGESVSLGGYSDINLNKDDLVEATYQNAGMGDYHLYCTVNHKKDGDKVNVASAFWKLMTDYSESTPAVEEEQPVAVDDFEQNDRMLDAAYIKEVVRIIDRMAFSEAKPDYVRSYNYLAFARLMCRLIDWESQADYYRGRLQLIFLLHDFAVNDRVDAKSLDTLQDTSPDLFSNDAVMSEKFRQLRIVSYIRKPENNSRLWEAIQKDDATKTVASLVLAYNILSDNVMVNQANDVLNRVKDTLSLKGYESNLDTYGPGYETKTVEYKTSIVFPPDNNMMPNIQQQMGNILAVVASFLNTGGGTLYIGCNNSGAGVGLENDLGNREFNGDRDKYIQRICNEISREFTPYVKTFVSVQLQKGEKSGKEIVVVDVKPYAPGVEFRGKWYYRDDSGKRTLTKADFEKYNAPRQATTPEPAKAPEPTPRPVSAPAPAAAPQIDTIRTSTLRENILTDDMGAYKSYAAFLKFQPNGKFCKMTSYDYSENTQLTLAVYDEEVQDGNLILGYEDGSVSKVPVKELLKFDDYKEYSRNGNQRIVFASIAFDTDGLLSINREKGKDRAVVRVDSVADIEPGRLQDNGQKLYNDGLAKDTIAFEIVPADSMDEAAGIVAMGTKKLGCPVKTAPESVKTLLKKCGLEDVE